MVDEEERQRSELRKIESDALNMSNSQLNLIGRVSLQRPMDLNSESSASQAGDENGRSMRFAPTYTLGTLIMLGFGNTIGSGVFTLTGVASKSAGSAAFVGFMISGMCAMLTALVYAEFSAIIPKSGSSYLYTYTTFGEFPAWIVGWNQNLRYGGTAAT